MPGRSITDHEIALIRAMLALGMRNRDIQFFFNRPDRPVNSGRITQIHLGTYGHGIPPTPENTLKIFMETFNLTPVGVSVPLQATAIPPTDNDLARARFEKRADGAWYLKDGETDQQECKSIVNQKRLSSIIKAIGALSNNVGGFIFFGVDDNSFKATGIGDEFESIDIADIVNTSKSFLSPTPVISSKSIIYLDSIKVGFIRIRAKTHNQ